MAGRVFEWDERLAPVEPALLQVAPDLIVATSVLVLGNESSEDLAGGVARLGWRALVGDEDLIDDGPERPEGRCRARPGERVGHRLGVRQRVANGVAPDTQLPGNLPGAEAGAVQPPDLCKVVHRTHPSPLRSALVPVAKAVLRWT